MPVSVDHGRGGVGNFNNRMGSNFLLCTYDICSAYKKLISVMCSLLLASVIMFLQTIINLLLLKNYYKFHSFQVCNVLISFLYLIIWYDIASWFRPFLILLSGDLETNSGPKSISRQSFSICHWNLNSISAHNYTKISLLTAYVLVHNFDIICLLETYLNSETSTDDQNLEIPGYCLLRADHPSNNKRGGICIFYRTTLPLRVLNISHLSECITFEISIGNQVCHFIHLYRSPRQTQEEFQTFISNLKLSLDALLCGNPFLTVMSGDFNAKSKDWCSIDITSFEGSELDFLTSQFGLLQIIKEPTHVLDNSRSYIDLIFTSQPNMAMFDLKIFYPPSYERTLWHFKHANSDHIKRVIDICDCESALNYIDANDQVSVFNSTILNIVSNFISDETITCDDRDPPWMNSFIKNLIRAKDNF